MTEDLRDYDAIRRALAGLSPEWVVPLTAPLSKVHVLQNLTEHIAERLGLPVPSKAPEWLLSPGLNAAVAALEAIHGPPPGGAESRHGFRWRLAYDKVRATAPRATIVRVEDGPVLWERKA